MDEYGNSPAERRAYFRRLFGGRGECVRGHLNDVLPDPLLEWIDRVPPEKLVLRGAPLGVVAAHGPLWWGMDRELTEARHRELAMLARREFGRRL